MLTITITLAGWLTDWLKIAHSRTMFECFSQSDCKVWQDNDALTVSERGREFINIVCWHNFAQEMNDGLKQWTFIQLPTFQIAFRKAAFRLLHSLKMNWCHMKWYTHKQQNNNETERHRKQWNTDKPKRFVSQYFVYAVVVTAGAVSLFGLHFQCNATYCNACVVCAPAKVLYRASTIRVVSQSLARSLAHTIIRPVNVCVCVLCVPYYSIKTKITHLLNMEKHTHTQFVSTS